MVMLEVQERGEGGYVQKARKPRVRDLQGQSCVML